MQIFWAKKFQWMRKKTLPDYANNNKKRVRE